MEKNKIFGGTATPAHPCIICRERHIMHVCAPLGHDTETKNETQITAIVLL
jgi:hypothetical protein